MFSSIKSRKIKPVQSKIVESNNIRDVLHHCSYNSFGAFDLDNTTFRPTHEEDLGSDQWFSKLHNHVYEVTTDSIQARQLSLALNSSVQKLIKIKPVESNTARIIKILRDVNLPVVGLTARGPDLVNTTLKQLHDIKVQFSKNLYPEEIRLDIGDPTRTVIYKDGVIFCDGADKGLCLSVFFKICNCSPDEVVMVDDVKANLKRGQAALKEQSIGFIGLRYGKLDKRISEFVMERSTTRLTAISYLFSPQTRSVLKRVNIEKAETPINCQNVTNKI